MIVELLGNESYTKHWKSFEDYCTDSKPESTKVYCSHLIAKIPMWKRSTIDPGEFISTYEFPAFLSDEVISITGLQSLENYLESRLSLSRSSILIPTVGVIGSSVSPFIKYKRLTLKSYDSLNNYDQSNTRSTWLTIPEIRKISVKCSVFSPVVTEMPQNKEEELLSKSLTPSHSYSLEDVSSYSDQISSQPIKDSSVAQMFTNRNDQYLPIWARLLGYVVPELDREEIIGDLCEGVASIADESSWRKRFIRLYSYFISTVVGGLNLRLYYFTEKQSKFVLAFSDHMKGSRFRVLNTYLSDCLKIGSTIQKKLQIVDKMESAKDKQDHSFISSISNNDQVAIVAALVFALVYLLCGPFFMIPMVKHTTLFGVGMTPHSN